MALFLVYSAGLEEQVLGGIVTIIGPISNNVILRCVYDLLEISSSI